MMMITEILEQQARQEIKALEELGDVLYETYGEKPELYTAKVMSKAIEFLQKDMAETREKMASVEEKEGKEVFNLLLTLSGARRAHRLTDYCFSIPFRKMEETMKSMEGEEE